MAPGPRAICSIELRVLLGKQCAPPRPGDGPGPPAGREGSPVRGRVDPDRAARDDDGARACERRREIERELLGFARGSRVPTTATAHGASSGPPSIVTVSGRSRERAEARGVGGVVGAEGREAGSRGPIGSLPSECCACFRRAGRRLARRFHVTGHGAAADSNSARCFSRGNQSRSSRRGELRSRLHRGDVVVRRGEPSKSSTNRPARLTR